MPGNCGTEAQCFWCSTYWFQEESYFSISSIAFPSVLRFAEGVSPVNHRTAVGRLELLVGVVH